MNGLEEIQKIINNFIDESKQAKQKISQIENERNILAQNRNQKKDANSNEYEAEINMLGKQIAELGNQSQELQNKLDAKYIDVKKVVNLMVDNLIAEGIRKARKLDEHIEELQEKVTIQKERKAKYEIQKQEFYERFGRVPEVSQEAKQEDEIQDRQCEIYNNKIQQLAEEIENQEVQLTELVNLKNNFRNKEWKQEVKQNIEEIEEVEEETAVLPFIEEINVEEMEPIEEIQVEKFEPIEEVNVPEFEPIEEIRIPEFEQEEINKTELIQKETEKNQSEIDEIEKLAKAIVEQIVEEQTQNNESSLINNREEQEIIAFKNEEKQEKVFDYNENAEILDIIAKIEDGEIVYKAQISNGKEIKVYPTKLVAGNILLKLKEKMDEIKEELINYSIEEYKLLDKKAIKKIDPIICEVLKQFAQKYNYDAGSFIYNYAMSFSKNILLDTGSVPITYNFSYLNTTKLSKKEKNAISKICKNAMKNQNIDIVGDVVALTGIKYIFKKLFALNSTNALPEGKY